MVSPRPTGGGVFVVAATNFLRRVDPALIRSGRLDLLMEIPMLDREARGCSSPASTAASPGRVGRQDAGRPVGRHERRRPGKGVPRMRAGTDPHGASHLGQADLLEQINVVRYGQRVSNPPLRDQLIATAYHEAGHAMVSMVLNPEMRVQQVTIVPRREASVSPVTTPSCRCRHEPGRVQPACAVALAGRMAEAAAFLKARAAVAMMPAPPATCKAPPGWPGRRSRNGASTSSSAGIALSALQAPAGAPIEQAAAARHRRVDRRRPPRHRRRDRHRTRDAIERLAPICSNTKCLMGTRCGRCFRPL